MGILHHVGLESGIREAYRLLKRGGKSVFFEHMSNGSTMNFVRNFLGREKTYTEHECPLTWQEACALRPEYNVRLHPFHMIRRGRRFLPWLNRPALLKFDQLLLRNVPGLYYFAGGIIIELNR